jgi:hypothetical protein
MKVETATPTDVMRPIGPYSHVAKAGPFIAISGSSVTAPSARNAAPKPLCYFFIASTSISSLISSGTAGSANAMA